VPAAFANDRLFGLFKSATTDTANASAPCSKFRSVDDFALIFFYFFKRKPCASLSMSGFLAEIFTRDWHKLRSGKYRKSKYQLQ